MYPQLDAYDAIMNLHMPEELHALLRQPCLSTAAGTIQPEKGQFQAEGAQQSSPALDNVSTIQ